LVTNVSRRFRYEPFISGLNPLNPLHKNVEVEVYVQWI